MILKLICAVLIAGFVRYIWCRRRLYILSCKIPTAFGLPFLGVFHKIRNFEIILPALGNYHMQFGNSVLIWLGPQAFFVSKDPKVIEKILTSPDCLNKGVQYEQVTEIVGDGLFSTSCPKWNFHRKLLNPAFSNKILLDLFPTFNQGANYILENMHNKNADIMNILQMATLKVATGTTKEENNDLTGFNAPTINPVLLKSFHRLLSIGTKIMLTPLLQIDFIFQFSRYFEEFVQAKWEIRKFVRDLIQYNTSQYKEESLIKNNNIEKGSDKPVKNVLINQIIGLAIKNQFSWEDVETEAIVMVFGAFETTSSTLFHTIMCLAMFPEFQEKLHEEVDAIVPNAASDITYEQIQNMPYLEMVLNEVLRMLPPVPLIGRTVGKDISIDDDLTLPGGTQALINIFHLHRDASIWGPNAHIFNPDNFTRDNVARRHPYGFAPFSKGARNCIGWRYAYLSIKVILAKLVKQYRFATDFKFEDLQYIDGISLKLKETPNIQIHPR